jgi:hypothetical protein
MATMQFDATEVPEDEGFEPIPEGEYSCQIIRSEMRDTKAGTGQFLELRVQILDAPFTGRLVFERLNLINPNEIAVKIANRTLADICLACGKDSIEDSEELHGIEFIAKVVMTEARGDWPPGNEIKKYKAA